MLRPLMAMMSKMRMRMMRLMLWMEMLMIADEGDDAHDDDDEDDDEDLSGGHCLQSVCHASSANLEPWDKARSSPWRESLPENGCGPFPIRSAPDLHAAVYKK